MGRLRSRRWPVALTVLALLSVMAGAPLAIAATSGNLVSGEAPVAGQRSHVHETELIQTITSRLGHLTGVQSNFRQTQTMLALRTPVISSGGLLFFRTEGVVWTTQSPIEQTFVITDAGVRAWHPQGDGKLSGAGADKRNSGAKSAAQVARMMQAMLSGDLSALYSQFDVRAQGTADAWQMDLSPNQPQLAQVIKSVRLRGGTFLDDIRITFSKGDVTDIAFSQQHALTQLSSEQQRYFEAP